MDNYGIACGDDEKIVNCQLSIVNSYQFMEVRL
jgi:hypothetical protein